MLPSDLHSQIFGWLTSQTKQNDGKKILKEIMKYWLLSDGVVYDSYKGQSLNSLPRGLFQPKTTTANAAYFAIHRGLKLNGTNLHIAEWTLISVSLSFLDLLNVTLIQWHFTVNLYINDPSPKRLFDEKQSQFGPQLSNLKEGTNKRVCFNMCVTQFAWTHM